MTALQLRQPHSSHPMSVAITLHCNISCKLQNTAAISHPSVLPLPLLCTILYFLPSTLWQG